MPHEVATASSSATRVRTCIAYRTRRPDTDLLRVVARRKDSGGVEVVADPKRRLPGRGAWITPDLGALELAEKRRAFGRALRISGRVDTEPVRRYLASDSLQAEVPVNDRTIVRKTEH